jgi:cation diffusion facilitator CzcD-associated flavoprotein CzcO
LLISNDYFAAIAREDVTVELDPIERIDATGVFTADGSHHELDVLIFATGFQSTDFLAPVAVTGLGGRRLHEAWREGARAHLGVTVAGFPNLFILYGPNTNLGHNSIIFMIEAQTRYVARAVREMIEGDLAWIDVRAEVMDRFGAEVDRAAADTVWLASCDSWYKDEAGRLTNNWPAFSVSYWRRLRRMDLDEFRVMAGRR